MDFQVGEIYVLNLVNGATVVGSVVDVEDNLLLVGRPMDLLVRQTPQGRMVAFIDHLSLGGMFKALDTYVMPLDIVLLARVAPKSIADQYRAEVTGIEVAPASSLIVPQ